VGCPSPPATCPLAPRPLLAAMADCPLTLRRSLAALIGCLRRPAQDIAIAQPQPVNDASCSFYIFLFGFIDGFCQKT
jgi:hypothetical protein